ncbi:MAG: hypothetical protein WC329_01905 [Candidatus Omnitrophota bacterium]|jgi:hypothetical protein
MGNRSGQRFTNQHKAMLARIDGNYCLICKNFGQGPGITRSPPEWPLQVHHARTDLKESNPRRWEYDVTCLACEPCNLSLRHKTPKELCQIIRICRLRNGRERERERARGRNNGRDKRQEYKGGIMEALDTSQGSYESNAKGLFLPAFKKFLLDRITEYGKYAVEELLDQFFDMTTCSQNTSRRYLKGWSSDTGIYRRYKDGGVWYITWRYDLTKPAGEKKTKGKAAAADKG